MSKSPSRRLRSDRRSARRSLVELTEVASRAVEDGLPAAPSAPAAADVDHRPHDADAAKTSGATRTAAGEAAAKAPVIPPEVAAAATPQRSSASESDSSADLAVKIAKELHAGAFEEFKLSMNAALDYARYFVEARAPAGGISEGDPAARPQDPLLTGLEAAVRYRAESLELVKANVETALDYAHELLRARTPGELVEVSSELARRQCEFALKQAGAMKSFARAVTKPDPK